MVNQVSRTIAYTKKKPVCSQNKLINISFWKNYSQNRGEFFFLSFLLKKVSSHTTKKKNPKHFFCFGLKDKIFLPSPHFSKKSLSTIKKIPYEE